VRSQRWKKIYCDMGVIRTGQRQRWKDDLRSIRHAWVMVSSGVR